MAPRYQVKAEWQKPQRSTTTRTESKDSTAVNRAMEIARDAAQHAFVNEEREAIVTITITRTG